MSLTPKEQVLDIEQMLARIEEIIIDGELPTKNLAGDLMSQSITEFREKLSKKIAELQEVLKNSGTP
jgi:hypothetical protein